MTAPAEPADPPDPADSTDPADPADPIVKDMAATWDDIVRLLPVALGGWPYEIDGTAIQVGTPDRGAVITVGPLPPRRLGLVEIRRSRVALAFHGLDAGEREAFLRQFDRAFQRGGG